ncbi:Bardet-Biedl syndrome 5 protein [Chytridium lagenaria]|nr:Bardet-Biedl syndrome 5 protein [Chytridium lagenaria]
MTGFKSHLLARPLEFWHDREIRFDLPPSELIPRPGESILETFTNVEDCRGNPNHPGLLLITPLRLIWIHPLNPKTNVSIGLNTISSTTTSNSSTKLKGRISSFTLQATCVERVKGTMEGYEETRAYRDFAVKGRIAKDGVLDVLPLESNNTTNLSTQHHTLGVLYITNLRIAWHAISDHINVSIPFCQLYNVRVQTSKYGHSLVVETTNHSGSYLLGFQVHPVGRMKELAKVIKKCVKAYAENPVFGFGEGLKLKGEKAKKIQTAIAAIEKMKEDDIEIVPVDPTEDLSLSLAEQRQFAKSEIYKHPSSTSMPLSTLQEEVDADADIVFDETLGLMVERIKPDGMTLKQLWKMF